MSSARRSIRPDPRLKNLTPGGDEVTPVYLQLARKLGEAIYRWLDEQGTPVVRALQ